MTINNTNLKIFKSNKQRKLCFDRNSIYSRRSSRFMANFLSNSFYTTVLMKLIISLTTSSDCDTQMSWNFLSQSLTFLSLCEAFAASRVDRFYCFIVFGPQRFSTWNVRTHPLRRRRSTLDGRRVENVLLRRVFEAPFSFFTSLNSLIEMSRRRKVRWWTIYKHDKAFWTGGWL